MPAPWKGARQLIAMRQAEERRAADRPRRERIARAYLRMRAQLNEARARCAAETRLAEDMAFQLEEMRVAVARETARADAAEAVAMPAIDRAQARIGQLEQMLAQATARGFTPKSRIAECFRATPRPMAKPLPTSNVIILSASGRA